MLMGMMRVVVDEGLADVSFIEERCENFDAFEESLENFGLDFVAEVTGVPRELIAAAVVCRAPSPAGNPITDTCGARKVPAERTVPSL